MSNTPLTIKTPGKLMIAGEFAVLVPNQHLVVMAVDRFVYATIQPYDHNLLTLENFKLSELDWDYTGNKVHVNTADDRVSFVENAMTVALSYLQEQSIPFGHFHLRIRSELDDASGIKYGLGSSAAVVTSVITAILKKYLPAKPSAGLIFKLAAISHVKTQGNGSGADVAASSYGGLLQYASFQAEWLKKEFDTAKNLTELLEKDWIYFSVKAIQLPDSIFVCIGWTGNPASTSKLVPQILKLQQDNPSQFQQFLTASEEAVAHFLQGAQEENIPLLLDGVKQNRRALATVGEQANTEIETPLLRKLCDLAEEYGGAGKPSGAGGGDCGIAFMPSEKQAQDLMVAWEEAGIKPLTLSLNPFGTVEIDA